MTKQGDLGRFSASDPHLAKPLLGWREWASLPELGIDRIKCKVDTGARSSCLHAFDVRVEQVNGESWVRFVVHPLQKSGQNEVESCSRLLDFRTVRSSSGHVERRPVIETSVRIGERSWTIQLTLTNRDEMGFRMLLGRLALKRRFWIDPHRSFVQGGST